MWSPRSRVGLLHMPKSLRVTTCLSMSIGPGARRLWRGEAGTPPGKGNGGHPVILVRHLDVHFHADQAAGQGGVVEPDAELARLGPGLDQPYHFRRQRELPVVAATFGQ